MLTTRMIMVLRMMMVKVARRYCDLPDCPWHEPRPNCNMRRGRKNYDDDDDDDDVELFIMFAKGDNAVYTDMHKLKTRPSPKAPN